jgi:hypothetical protein
MIGIQVCEDQVHEQHKKIKYLTLSEKILLQNPKKSFYIDFINW